MKKVLPILLWILSIIAVIHVTNQYTHIEENLMAIAESTLSFITKEEGSKNKAYHDSKGLLTIGVGHLIRSDEAHLVNTVLTDEQIKDLLKSDLKRCSEAVEAAVKVPLQQPQFDALYSLCFNIGPTAFKNSTVVRKINENDLKGAADAILMWNRPAVLQKRRQRERDLFLSAI